MEVLGLNDIRDCVFKGDIGACVMMVVGALPWAKILKAKKISEALWRAGKAVMRWIDEVRWARRLLARADEAAAVAARQADDVAATAARRVEEAAAGSSCKKTGNSFTPDTRVVLADGSSKPIEEIELGDEVLATDPQTGATEARPVVALVVGEGHKNLVEVTVDTDGHAGDATGSVIATDGHPFWVADLNTWVTAAKLAPGQWLRTSAGTWVQIAAVRPFTQERRVHNLTIADTHTYYVLAGDQPVLVHNCNIGDRSLDELHALASARNSKPGARNPGPTAAGRSIDKHAAPNRGPEQHARYNYGDTTPADRDWIGQTLVEEILTDPNSRRNLVTSANGDSFVDIQMPNGIGARWAMEGGLERFVGFRVFDPY